MALSGRKALHGAEPDWNIVTIMAIGFMLDAGIRPSLKEVAAMMDISARTLRRNLRLVGTTFGSVLNGMLKNRALGLLKNHEFTVSDIAEMCCYKNLSSFTRKFITWFGNSPQQYRRQHFPVLSVKQSDEYLRKQQVDSRVLGGWGGDGKDDSED